MTRWQRGMLAASGLGALATAGLYLATLQGGEAPARQARAPDLFIEQPVWRQFGEDGSLRRELRAGRLEQWPGEDRARLSLPRLELTDHRQQTWRATAERGWIPENRHSLVLDSDVRLQREIPAGGPVVRTERLSISDRGDVIETGQPVVLTSGNWHFSATGLRAELGRQQLELLGNVRGIHE